MRRVSHLNPSTGRQSSWSAKFFCRKCTSFHADVNHVLQCTVTCGRGHKTRAVTCVDVLGNVLPDAECGDDKPKAHRKCRKGKCPRWIAKAWSKVRQGETTGLKTSGVPLASGSSQSKVHSWPRSAAIFWHRQRNKMIPSTRKHHSCVSCIGQTLSPLFLPQKFEV